MVQVDVIAPPRHKSAFGPCSSQSEANETPVIIDPSSRNLVADQQTGAESGAETGFSAGDNESTSVITPDELQAYFSRLAPRGQYRRRLGR